MNPVVKSVEKPVVNRYLAPWALLPGGWARDVRIDVGADGSIAAVADGALRVDVDAPSADAASTASGARVAPDSIETAPLVPERLDGPVLPGMPNLHSHAFQRAMAGLAEVRDSPDDDFWSWRELMYRFAARLTPEIAHTIARRLYVEMLRNGYTAVGEFHYVHRRPDGTAYAGPAEMLLRHLAAARETGIAITLLPVLYRWADFGSAPLHDRQRRFAGDPASVLRIVEAARRAAGSDPDVRVGVAPHSLRAVDAVSLRELVDGLTALDPRAPVHVHAAEQTKEVDASLATTGLRPVEWLLSNQPVDDRWCLVHATHMTPQETAALARSGAVAGLCPTTEANLGDGLFALPAFREAGGCWGIGGDSHVSRDPVEELRWLEYGQRLARRRRNLVTGGDVAHSNAVGTTLWSEAAFGGARALGRATGAIAPGLRADLVELDACSVELDQRRGDEIANALVFSGSADLVRNVMVGGRWVVRDRRHRLDDELDGAYRQAVRALRA